MHDNLTTDILTTDVLNGVSLAIWGRLYDLADRLKKLAPWRWIGAGDVFGVQLPGADAVWLVTFLSGGDQEYSACTICQGWDAWRELQALQAREPSDHDTTLLEIPHLQVVFTSRAFVSAAEKNLLGALGRRYRGRHDWTVFRSFQPGYLPWLLAAAEAKPLLAVLHQTLGVALRVEGEPDLLQREPGKVLVRVPPTQAAEAWHEVWRAMPVAPHSIMSRPLDQAALAALQREPQSGVCLEADLALTGSCMQPEPGARAQTLYALALVEADSGYVYHAELMQALDGLAVMQAHVPEKVLQIWRKHNSYPREVRVRSDRMMNLLRPLAEKLPFRLVRCAELPKLEAFLTGMARMLKQTRCGSSGLP